MSTRHLALTLASVTTLAMLSGCREPNAPQATSQPGPPPAAPASPAIGSVAAPSGTSDAPKPATLCNIETIGGQLLSAEPMLIEGGTVVRGWLADDSGATPTQPKLIIAGTDKKVVREIPVQLSIKRADVVNAYPGQTGLESSGFEAAMDPADLKPHTYHLYLGYELGSVIYSCDNGRYIEIR